MESPDFWFGVAKWFKTEAGILNLVLVVMLGYAEWRCSRAVKAKDALAQAFADTIMEDVAAKKDLTHAIESVLQQRRGHASA